MEKRKAKLESLSDLSSEMSKMMGDDYSKGMGKMKVSVASDSKKGLEKGLDKAKDLMSKRLGEQHEDDFVSEEHRDAKEHKEEEKEDMDKDSPEYVKRKIAELQKKLSKMEE